MRTLEVGKGSRRQLVFIANDGTQTAFPLEHELWSTRRVHKVYSSLIIAHKSAYSS